MPDVYTEACALRGWDPRLCEDGAHLIDLGAGRWRLEARALIPSDPEWAENPPGTRLASYDVDAASATEALQALGVLPRDPAPLGAEPDADPDLPIIDVDMEPL